MKRSTSRILTTHTGSLPRPEGLVGMLGAVSRGEPVEQATLDAAADEATAGVVAAQLAAGVDVINNGEQSRISFSTYVNQRMSGFGGAWSRRGHRDQNEFPSLARPRVVQLTRDVPTCVGPLAYERLDLVERECRQFLDTVGAAEGEPEDLFMTAASPGIVALTMANCHYASHEDYVFALAEELRKEYEIIVANGLTLQLDCPDLAMERHISYQDEPLSAFQDLVALHIRAINHALTNIPRDRVRLHVCWGNSEGPHIYDVPLEEILGLLYEAKVGALVMEMANPRHGHEHRVYRDNPLPEGMMLVTGVIDTKTNYVEHPRLVADRLHQAVAATGGDPTCVLAGTDCGFDTSAGSNRVDAGIVWLKLRAMREGANIASRELF
jgi:5-methyltetrahydropteroyltriglutamate--homocysteine methyltransferase